MSVHHPDFDLVRKFVFCDSEEEKTLKNKLLQSFSEFMDEYLKRKKALDEEKIKDQQYFDSYISGLNEDCEEEKEEAKVLKKI